MKVHGRLELAATELLAANPTVGVVKGRFFYDSALSVLKVYDGSAWQKVSFQATTETLTNKTMSGASNTFTNIPLSTGVTGVLPVVNGGTGSSTNVGALANLLGGATLGQLAYANGTQWTALAAGNPQQVLKMTTAGAVAWAGDERTIDIVQNGRFSTSGVLSSWVAGSGSVTIAQEATSSSGPLYPLVYPGIKITSSVNVSESRQGHANYSGISLPTAFQGKSMKLVFAYKTPSASTWKVSLYYQNNTRPALSTDSAGSTTLSANTSDIYSGTFTLANPLVSALTIEFTRTAGAGGAEDFYLQALSITPNF